MQTSSRFSPTHENQDITISDAEEHLSPEELEGFKIWYAQKSQSLPAGSKRVPSPSPDSEATSKRPRTQTTVSTASSSSSLTLSSLPLASPEEGEEDDDDTSTDVGDDEALKVSPQPLTELPASLALHVDAENEEEQQRVLSLIWNSSDRTVLNLFFCAATYEDEDGNICWVRGCANLPPGVSLADYVGISLNPFRRIGEHLRALAKAGPLSSLHYRLRRLTKSMKAVTGLKIEDVVNLATRLEPTCPILAKLKLNVKHWTQCFLVGAEALFCLAARAFRGDFVYHDELRRLLGFPTPGTVGLNSNACLTTGVVGLAGNVVRPREPRDRKAEREAGIQAAARRGVGVVLHCAQVKGQKGQKFLRYFIRIPWSRSDDEDVYTIIELAPATRKDLGLDLMKAGDSSHQGADTPSSRRPQYPVDALLVLFRHQPTLEYNGRISNIVGVVNEDQSTTMGEVTVLMLRHIGDVHTSPPSLFHLGSPSPTSPSSPMRSRRPAASTSTGCTCAALVWVCSE